jgi:hypothetical protein
MDELLAFLCDADAAAAVRSRAAVAVASLAAGADGDSATSAELQQHAPALLRALLAQLRGGGGAGAGADAAQQPVRAAAAAALVALSACRGTRGAFAAPLAAGAASSAVDGLLDWLRDAAPAPGAEPGEAPAAAAARRLACLALANACAPGAGDDTGAGTARLMAAWGGRGAALRRAVQWLAAGAGGGEPAGADGADVYGGLASALASATAGPSPAAAAARRALLDRSHALLPALLPQLSSPSARRRRGVASALRNVLLEPDDDEATARYLLSPAVGLAAALLWPLAGAGAGYSPAERAGGLPAPLAAAPAGKPREPDAAARRALVECLLLLCCTRYGRFVLRQCRAYLVVRSFHVWLERGGVEPDAAGAAAAAAAADADAMVTSAAADAAVPDGPLPPDDEACVDAINRLVQQLFREDEVSHTSEVTGVATAPAAAALAAAAPPRRARAGASVPLATAREIAAAVSRGADVDARDLASLVTPLGDEGWAAL